MYKIITVNGSFFNLICVQQNSFNTKPLQVQKTVENRDISFESILKYIRNKKAFHSNETTFLFE